MANATDATGGAVESAKPFGLQLGAVGFAIANFIIIQAISYGVWVLFVDPKIGVWKFYPQPFGAYLFWAILVVVFIGFNLGMHGFCKIRQPMGGVVATLVTVALGFVIPMLLIFGWGKLDPAFSSTNFAGHGAAGLIVLIGFYGFGFVANSTDGWPWTDAGMKQPMVGWAQILTGFFLTTIGYLAFVYPSLASWTAPDRVLMSLPTAIGWFYSVILVWLTTVLILDLWPYSMFKTRAGRALAAFFGNFIIGTVFYYGLLALLKNVLIPADALEKIGGAINLWPAQLGVWIVHVLLLWALCCGNAPTSLSPAMNRILRFIITYALGIGAFVVYMKWFAMGALNEAAIVPGFGGDPLTWVDLLNLILLFYVCYFGCYGLAKKPVPCAVCGQLKCECS
jgi:amino acid transporter, AAT family